MYLVELAYRNGRRVERGRAEEKTPELIRFRNAVRRAHRDVAKGLANVSVRKVGP
jgi:hypothetical protein